MPLGDSITFGDGSSDLAGYRSALFARALDGKHAITFVGSASSGPARVNGVAFPSSHEGYPGFTIGALSMFVRAAITTHRPHIVLLMIGTNDQSMLTETASLRAQLATLIDQILAADAHLLLLVAQLVPTQDDARNVRVEHYNAAIAELVQQRADSGDHIALVDMYSAFRANAAYKTAYFVDDVHPSDAGYAVMADVWYAALAPLLR